MSNKIAKILLIITTYLCFLILYLPLSHADVILTIGNGSGMPGSSNNPVEVSLENLDDPVRVVQLDICDVDDYLFCTTCETTERTFSFICEAYEQKNGCVGVILFSPTCNLIDEDVGPIFTLKYNVSEEAPPGECRDLNPENVIVSDFFGDALTTDTSPGKFCFQACGDVYPPESSPGANDCGDSIVGLVDLMTEIDFALGAETPDACQLIRGDVPTGEPGRGEPPYCSAPDGIINIFDIMVIIDMLLNRPDCCSYYYTGTVY